jgi:exodeoxyribonuclease V beta subunit
MSRFVSKPHIVDQVPPGASAVLEASAGTGKTFAIEHVVADLVLGGTPIERMLVITFTEKAAGELKTRLHELFRRLPRAPPAPGGWRLDATAESRLEAARRGLPRAHISTIHAFCQRVQAEFPVESQSPFELELVSERQAFDAGVRIWLRHGVPRDPVAADYVQAWMAERPLAPLLDLWFEVYQRNADVEPAFDPEAWRSALAALRQQPVKAWGRAVGSRRDRTAIGAWVRWVQRSASPAASLAEADRDGISLRRVSEILGPELEVDEAALLDRIAAAQTSFEAACAAVGLSAVRHHTARAKAERGWQTYGDMIAGVVDAPTALTDQVRTRFDAVLVDEFQDTDPDQWSIIRRLFVEGPARVILVGDPKQSIYGFRGADVRAFREAQVVLQRGGAAALSLQENHRSSPSLVASLNQLFGGLFTGDNAAVTVRSARPADSGLTREDRRLSPVHVFHFSAEVSAGSVVQVRRAWARAIAADIVTHLDGNTWVDGDRPLRPKEIFVLTRTAREGRQVAQVLRGSGIPIRLFEREGVLQGPEARALLTLLEALATDDPRRQAAAWLTPFFGVEPAQVAALTDLPVDHPLLEQLATWSTRWRDGDWVGLGQACLAAAEPRMRATPERWGDAGTLQQVVDELVARGGAPDEGRRWLARAIEGGEAPALAHAEDDVDAVRISTIHAAKGLESEVVFLFGGLKPHRPRVTLYRAPGGPRVYVGRQPPGRAATQVEEEEERLLYVALTRARSRVVVPRFDADFDGPIRHLARGLAQLGLPDGIDETPVEPSAPKPRMRPAPALTAPTIDSASPPLWWTLGPMVTSYTDLKRRTPDREDETPDGLRVDAPGPPPELPGGARTGQCVHRLLERTEWSRLAHRSEADLLADAAVPLREEMDRYGLDRSHAPALARLLSRTVGRSLPLPGRGPVPLTAVDASAIRELDFTLHLAETDTLVRGFLDLVFTLDGATYIVDYKTDVRPTYAPEPLAEHCRAHYALQADLYATALRAARPESTVVAVLFLFVRAPSDEGVVVHRVDGGERARVVSAVVAGGRAGGDGGGRR